MQMFIHTYMHTYINMYIHTYIHTHIHTYIYIYIYTYCQPRLQRQLELRLRALNDSWSHRLPSATSKHPPGQGFSVKGLGFVHIRKQLTRPNIEAL